jgi:phosphatidylglycerol:prolipoprotein diacylglycerol transferase
MFRIPLPAWTVPWLWLLLGAAGVAALVAIWQLAVKNREGAALWGAIAAVAAGAGVYLKDRTWDMAPIPIYSYGVMLGLSLVVGWYLTLGLAERDGLPKETMANNYIVTAVAAVIGSRILYILTNWGEFEHDLGSMFAMRRGGLVAYGGFLGGLVGSLVFLRRHKIPLLPWADVAVPSLASGLMITRIGCYLFGCDFGQRLPASAPEWLKTLGSFPHWAAGTLDQGGNGAPAWAHHVKLRLISEAADHSLPVHPTQLYESLVGAMLLALLLLSRRVQKFRGQIFLLFTFSYGVCRFLLELLRDDAERGSLPPALPEHILFPGALLLLSIGYLVGFSRMITNVVVQRVTQVIAFVPPLVVFLLLRPESFGNAVTNQLSTSQAVAVVTGFAACLAFSVYYKAALAHPESAMDLGLPPEPQESDEQANEADTSLDADADEDDATVPAGDRPVRKARAADKPERDGDGPKKASAKKLAKTKPGTKKKKASSSTTSASGDASPQASGTDASKSTEETSSASTDDSAEER